MYKMLEEIRQQFADRTAHREGQYAQLVHLTATRDETDYAQLALMDAMRTIESSGRSLDEFERDVAAGRVVTRPVQPGQLRAV